MDHVRWLFFVQRWGEGGTKGRLSRYVEIFWNKKKAFRYYIKQIDCMLPCVWFSNRSQKTSKCGKNISDTLGYASSATFLFLPHFGVICDLLLNRRTATWNLFVNLSSDGIGLKWKGKFQDTFFEKVFRDFFNFISLLFQNYGLSSTSKCTH